MNTLIIYGGKYGTTKACAQKIAAQLSGAVEVKAAKQCTAADIAGAVRVIVGTSIYAGTINKEVAALLQEQQLALLQKDFAFFVCGMSGYEAGMDWIRETVAPELLAHAQVYDFLGGEYRFDQMNFFEKQIIKMINKKEGKPLSGKENVSQLSDERLAAFVAKL